MRKIIFAFLLILSIPLVNYSQGCAVQFSVTPNGCPTISFTAMGLLPIGVTATGWAWNFGDGGTSTLQNPTHTYTQNGTYQVCVTMTASNGCTHTSCQNLTISCISGGSTCNANFQNVMTNCPTVSFTDASTASPGTIISRNWDFGDGNSSSATNPTHTYAANGNYTVCLSILTSDTCTDTMCNTITVNCITPPGCNANPTWAYGTNGCPEVQFTDSSTTTPGSIISWTWDFGDGNTSTMQHPSHTYLANGTYNVCLTITTTDTCLDTHCVSVPINCIQSATCGASFGWDFDTLNGCPFVVFSDSSTASPGSLSSWTWNFGDGNSSTTQNPSHTYSADGDYQVCLDIVTSDSCSDQYCDSVSINCLTTIDVNYADEFGLKIFPNPTADQIEINFALESPAEVSFELYSIEGKVLESARLGKLIRGEKTLKIDLACHDFGAYILQLNIAGNQFIRRIIAVR